MSYVDTAIRRVVNLRGRQNEAQSFAFTEAVSEFGNMKIAGESSTSGTDGRSESR